MSFSTCQGQALRVSWKNLQTSLRSACIFPENLDKPDIAILFAQKRRTASCFINILTNTIMQKTIFNIALYAIGIWFLMKMGIGLFWAVIVLLIIKGLFRFVGCLFRMIPLSLVIAILIIYFLSRI